MEKYLELKPPQNRVALKVKEIIFRSVVLDMRNNVTQNYNTNIKNMKQNTKHLVAGGLVGATLMVAGSAFASFPQEAKDALAEGDFAAFQVAVEGTRAANLPEEVFDLKVDLQDARESGDEDSVIELKAQLKEYKTELKEYKTEQKEEKKAAVEAGDYDAFVALIPEGKDAPSEEVFGLLGDLSEARADEDEDAVTEIRAELAELGVEKKAKQGNKKGKRAGKKGSRTDR